MALKGGYETVEQIPEGIREHYAKAADGKFRPVIEGGDGWAFEDVTGLRKALGSERSEREKLAALAKQYDGLDPAAAREAMEKAAQMANWTPEQKVREQIEAREKAVAEKLGKETAAERARREKVEKALERALIDGQAALAVQRHKGVPGAAQALLPHLRGRVRLVEQSDGSFGVRVLDEHGNPALTTRSGKTGDMDMDELVETFKGNDVFGRFFEGSGASGGGAQGSARPLGSGAHRISRAEARNPAVYAARKEAAEKAGVELAFID